MSFPTDPHEGERLQALLETGELPRYVAFCNYTILSDEVFVAGRLGRRAVQEQPIRHRRAPMSGSYAERP